MSSERSIVEALDQRDAPAIDVDGTELGRVAADMLIARLADPDAETQRSRLDVAFDPGQ